jgi:hypothetical protein
VDTETSVTMNRSPQNRVFPLPPVYSHPIPPSFTGQQVFPLVVLDPRTLQYTTSFHPPTTSDPLRSFHELPRIPPTSPHDLGLLQPAPKSALWSSMRVQVDQIPNSSIRTFHGSRLRAGRRVLLQVLHEKVRGKRREDSDWGSTKLFPINSKPLETSPGVIGSPPRTKSTTPHLLR